MHRMGARYKGLAAHLAYFCDQIAKGDNVWIAPDKTMLGTSGMKGKILNLEDDLIFGVKRYKVRYKVLPAGSTLDAVDKEGWYNEYQVKMVDGEVRNTDNRNN